MLVLHIPDMSCGHCAATVTKAVQSVAAGAQVDVDLPARIARVTGDAAVAPVLRALADAGYPAEAQASDRP
ncbi:hypothetical protein GCM10019059_23860 [Camelimonas fluminis]|uniref:Heavy-metal-associated domain-containing protein n=1 Tax=Camelimonas fluminis TaxID=1576911 RepID=A0ABV7UIC4_9HYPH|nr:heavy-metal-associated domain-containing protein [Camelimonas fluminis]GHE63450.1 hypothetical protein GCM10019059_23860 [Camelimonas fluminis]